MQNRSVCLLVVHLSDCRGLAGSVQLPEEVYLWASTVSPQVQRHYDAPFLPSIMRFCRTWNIRFANILVVLLMMPRAGELGPGQMYLMPWEG